MEFGAHGVRSGHVLMDGVRFLFCPLHYHHHFFSKGCSSCFSARKGHLPFSQARHQIRRPSKTFWLAGVSEKTGPFSTRVPFSTFSTSKDNRGASERNFVTRENGSPKVLLLSGFVDVGTGSRTANRHHFCQEQRRRRPECFEASVSQRSSKRFWTRRWLWVKGSGKKEETLVGYL